MAINKFKRYTTWTDDTLWRKTAIQNGLVYGVYDHKENTQVYPKDVTITSYKQACEEAAKLNDSLENPFDY